MILLDDIFQGDGFRFDVTLRSAGRVPEGDITAYKFWFTAKSAASKSDADALFQLSSDAGDITVFDAANWVLRVRGRSVHTKGKPPGRYVLDFQAQAPGDDPETVDDGVLVLRPEITRAP